MKRGIIMGGKIKGKREKINKTAGFTLIEMIIVISLIGVVMTAAAGFIKFSLASERKVEDEYVLQSEMRHATEIVNNAVRDASVTFIMPGALEADRIKNKWCYIGISEDGSEIVQYLWTENEDGTNGKHIKRVLVSAKDDASFFLRLDNKEKTKLVGYRLGLDKEDGRSLEVSSMLSAINSIAVDFYSTDKNPAALIAYRTDPRPQPEGNKAVTVVISMILDDSGSMAWNMMGGTRVDNNENKARKIIMKAKAEALIDSFPENVHLGIVGYSNNANNPSALINLANPSKKLEAKRKIPNDASGGTNTGDALRRAYHQLKTYEKAADEEVLNYIILLTDGNPTYFSHTNYSKRSSYSYSAGDRNIPTVATGDYQTGTGNITYLGGPGSDDPKDNCLNYTKTMGDIIKADRSLKAKTFVIGFSGVPEEVTRAKTIAANCNTASTSIDEVYFYAGSEESLGIAFDAIKESILLEVWHIYGPYGKPEE